MVNIECSAAPFLAANPGDASHDGRIKINELVNAVRSALNGCGGSWRQTNLALTFNDLLR